MGTQSTWKVVYRERGEEKTARENLAHKDACQLADALEREGWRHVEVVRQEQTQ
jgi:hypothetical protein